MPRHELRSTASHLQISYAPEGLISSSVWWGFTTAANRQQIKLMFDATCGVVSAVLTVLQ